MGARISPAAEAAKSVDFFVCLSVTLLNLNVRVCMPDFAMKSLEYRNDFDAVVHPCSTFSDCGQLATPLNAEIQKNGPNNLNDAVCAASATRHASCR